MQRDVLQAVITDLHVGSQYSICADRVWSGVNNNSHVPNSDQIKVIARFNATADTIAKLRNGKQLKLLLLGDLIEGALLGTNEVWTSNPSEMADVATEILIDFKKRVNWQAGDLLYCLRGTYRHSEDWEESIGKELDAEVGDNGKYSQDEWRIETNGKLTWAIHQWVSPGTGVGEGSPIYNALKTIHITSLRDMTRAPDIVYGAHFHQIGYAAYSWRSGIEFGNMHGVTCPSFKLKDRFAAKASKFSRNVIGGMAQLITSDGVVDVPRFV